VISLFADADVVYPVLLGFLVVIVWEASRAFPGSLQGW